MTRRRRRHELEQDDIPTKRQRGGRRTEVEPSNNSNSVFSESAEVLVSNLPPECTVLELKSRMEMFGPVARIRIDSGQGIGYVKFRTLEHAQSAVDAAGNPRLGVEIGSQKVQVRLDSDAAPELPPTLPVSRQSKLVSPELPLRRRGRVNRLLIEGRLNFGNSESNTNHSGRQIVGYDDIL
ncbi:homeobox leucine zipper protein [Wolffia australiana]